MRGERDLVDPEGDFGGVVFCFEAEGAVGGVAGEGD